MRQPRPPKPHLYVRHGHWRILDRYASVNFRRRETAFEVALLRWNLIRRDKCAEPRP